MRKTFFLPLFCLLAFALPAQDARVGVGVEASAGFSGIRFHAAADPTGLYRAVEENLAPRFATGLNAFVRYRMGRRFSVQAGLGYWLYGYRQKRFAVNSGPPSPFYILPAVTGIESKTTFADLAFPVDIRYQLSTGKNRCYLMAGVLPLYGMNHKQTDISYYEDGSSQANTYDDNFTRDFNLSGRFGAGLEMPMGARWRLYVQPTAAYALLNAYEPAFFSMRPYSFAVHTGVVF